MMTRLLSIIILVLLSTGCENSLIGPNLEHYDDGEIHILHNISFSIDELTVLNSAFNQHDQLSFGHFIDIINLAYF